MNLSVSPTLYGLVCVESHVFTIDALGASGIIIGFGETLIKSLAVSAGVVVFVSV